MSERTRAAFAERVRLAFPGAWILVFVTTLLLLFGWYTLTLGDRQAEWCRRIYARAHSAADSARADRVVAGGRAPANSSTCVQLRQDGTLDRRRQATEQPAAAVFAKALPSSKNNFCCANGMHYI